MSGPDPVHVAVSPEPTEAELAVILATYREVWPRPVEAPSRTDVSRRWKFSGRWWSDAPARRGYR